MGRAVRAGGAPAREAREELERGEQRRGGLGFNLRRSMRRSTMLSWAVVFLVVAIIAGLLGFTGVAGTAANIAWILFVIGIILAIVFFVMGRRGPL
jgi:uncharacterized membrane protein YtjA (UPF0391 family)